MSISAVIIDDERNNIANLSILLQEHFPDINIIGEATDAVYAEELILLYKPDIIFLDIQMPGKNGFDLLASLRVHHFQLIFVTAFDQFGIQAIKFSAIDYLLKPVNPEELQKAVLKAISRSAEKKQNARLENLLDVWQHQQKKDEHRIALSSSKEVQFIKANEIVRCESSNNYTTFYTAVGESIITSRPIFEYEEILEGYGFIRCHQTHLVNKRFVKSMVKQDGGYLLLENGDKVPVARQKKDLVRKALE